jgi:hypothetical protein
MAVPRPEVHENLRKWLTDEHMKTSKKTKVVHTPPIRAVSVLGPDAAA